MAEINVIFQIFILIFSVIIHEISHGLMALFWGDRTAQYEGRLTLNPMKHIDLFGSILVPFFLYIFSAGFIIGWAKPVPYNPYNLRNRNISEPLVALAGPLSNIFVALIFGGLMRLLFFFGLYSSPLIIIFGFIVFLNIVLAVFNLIPIPPLDGSKVLFPLLPIKNRFAFSAFAQRYGLLLVILFVVFAIDLILPIINSLFRIITGI
jgi:Zn-dependent protease